MAIGPLNKLGLLMFLVRGLVVAVLVVALTPVQAQAEEKENEPFAIIEFGAAGAWEGASSSFGPSVAVEFSPLKNFEIEPGLTLFFDKQGHAEWDTDLSFRRSFDLSKTVELEPGIGLSWSSSSQLGAVASVEFQIWPWQERKVGWFVEPSYSVSLTPVHQQSVGLTVGILVGIPAN
jgi:hypothetical protein